MGAVAVIARSMLRMKTVDLPSMIAPWAAQARQAVPGVRLFDAHTHLGQNDPDGMKQTPAELLEVLAAADAVGGAGTAPRSRFRCTSSTATRPPTTW